MDKDYILATGTSMKHFISNLVTYEKEDIEFILKYTDKVTLFNKLPDDWFMYVINNNIYLLYNANKLFDFLVMNCCLCKDIYNRFFNLVPTKSLLNHKIDFYDLIVNYIRLKPSKEEIKFIANKFFIISDNDIWDGPINSFIDNNVDKLANELIRNSSQCTDYELDYLDKLIGIRLTREAVFALCNYSHSYKSNALNLIRFFNCYSANDFITISKYFILSEYLEREFLTQIIGKIKERDLLDLRDYIQHKNLFNNLRMTFALADTDSPSK